ncbi:MAG: aspartate 1-decarboxylase [Ignavibacteria bacterium]|nr:aspartate 1-decarboxylase [Ignavibacteria bacterium]
MLKEMFKSKIHRATVTEAELFYEGSLTLDAVLMEEAGMLVYEKVQVVNLNNGSRLDTYLIAGERNSGIVCLNGPAARLGNVGDEIIIINYGFFNEEELRNFKPKIVHVDKKNRIIKE